LDQLRDKQNYEGQKALSVIDLFSLDEKVVKEQTPALPP
jgi:hypothetical protein